MGGTVQFFRTAWRLGGRFTMALLVLAHVAPAPAQSPPLHNFPTINGCNIVLAVYTKNVRLPQPVEWAGPCVDGFAEGYGRLAYVLESELGSRRVVVRGGLVAGKLQGLAWFLNRAHPLPDTNEPQRLSIRQMLDGRPGPFVELDAKMPFSEMHAKVSAFIDTVPSHPNGMRKADLFDDLKSWHLDPAGFPITTIRTNGEPAQTRTDDPKARGRSSRVR